jgi:hypothetical protein
MEYLIKLLNQIEEDSTIKDVQASNNPLIREVINEASNSLIIDGTVPFQTRIKLHRAGYSIFPSHDKNYKWLGCIQTSKGNIVFS